MNIATLQKAPGHLHSGRKAGLTRIESEDVKHPAHVWADPEYAEEDLPRLRQAYVDYLRGRANPASEQTIEKYSKSLLGLMRSIGRQGMPPVLASITAQSVNAWVMEQRSEGRSEHGIASRLTAIKAFTSAYIYKQLELTTRDLLYKVKRISPPDQAADPLTDEEIEQILSVFDGHGYENVRNRALLTFYIATGMRLGEVLDLDVRQVDRVSGEIKMFVGKGKRERCAWLSPGALKHLKAYLKVRPNGESSRLWLTSDGAPLSLWGAHSVMRRLRERSGIARMHWHLFRHGFAQHALKLGADLGTVQEMLGHTSNTMTRRYAGHVKQTEAARRMPQYARI